MESNIKDGANYAKHSARSYIELSSNVYSLFLDALTSRTQRRLEYWKSVWEVSSRPYQLTAVEGTVRDACDRANEILDLTANELKSDVQNAADFSEKLVSYATNVKDVSINATQHQFNGRTKQLEEVERRIGAAVNAN